MKTNCLTTTVVAVWFLLFVVGAAEESNNNNNNNNNNNDDEQQQQASEHNPYDIAWATHSTNLTHNQDRYNDFIQKCQQAAANANANANANKNNIKNNNNNNNNHHDICILAEEDRMKRNRIQPRAMKNYTKTGFHVMPIPTKLYDRLMTFWNKHWTEDSHTTTATDSTDTTQSSSSSKNNNNNNNYNNNNNIEIEWKNGITHAYQNSWEAPTSMIPIQNLDLKLRNDVWNEMRGILEQWTQERLAPSAFWGIRIYPRHALLAPHVDVTPRIISAILNIDQQVDTTTTTTTTNNTTKTTNKDWPLEVWGHDGKAYNITLHPGEMALYESHSIIHGRPYPLEGNYYANIFVHFEPLGVPWNMSVQDYITAQKKQQQKETTTASSSTSSPFPPYIIIPASNNDNDTTNDDEMVQTWHRTNPRGWTLFHHELARYIIQGDLRSVENILITQPHMFHTKLPKAQGGNDLYAIELAQRYERTQIVKLLKRTHSYPSHITIVLDDDDNHDEDEKKKNYDTTTTTTSASTKDEL